MLRIVVVTLTIMGTLLWGLRHEKMRGRDGGEQGETSCALAHNSGNKFSPTGVGESCGWVHSLNQLLRSVGGGWTSGRRDSRGGIGGTGTGTGTNRRPRGLALLYTPFDLSVGGGEKYLLEFMLVLQV